ncbi:MAG: nucleotidyltransferase family protein [Acidobacteriota bacterium]
MKALKLLQFLGRILCLPYDPTLSDLLDEQIRKQVIPWEKVASLANSHLVTPALYTALRDSCVAHSLPEDFVTYLREIHDLNAARNRAILNELSFASTALNKVGIEPILLKGAGNLVRRIYPGEGDRFLNDIDVLVPKGQIDHAFAKLLSAGYERGSDVELTAKGRHHAPRLIRPQSEIPLELHIRAQRTVILPDPGEETDRQKLPLVPGLPFRARVPAVPQQAALGMVHRQLQHRWYAWACPSLRDLWDTLLLARQAPAPDWESLEDSFAAAGIRHLYADFVEWGLLLLPAFPLRRRRASPLTHRLRKGLSLRFPAYACLEELFLQPVGRIRGMTGLIQNGVCGYGALPAETVRRVTSRQWWRCRWRECRSRRRKLGG